jgi:hypothetical protein
MSGPAESEEPGYHLFLNGAEVPVAATAVRLFLSDEAGAPDIRRLAREVLDELAAPAEGGRLTLALTPRQMKITHSAVSLLLKDLPREEADELTVLRAILEKLPDEHTMRAISLG